MIMVVGASIGPIPLAIAADFTGDHDLTLRFLALLPATFFHRRPVSEASVPGAGFLRGFRIRGRSCRNACPAGEVPLLPEACQKEEHGPPPV